MDLGFHPIQYVQPQSTSTLAAGIRSEWVSIIHVEGSKSYTSKTCNEHLPGSWVSWVSCLSYSSQDTYWMILPTSMFGVLLTNCTCKLCPLTHSWSNPLDSTSKDSDSSRSLDLCGSPERLSARTQPLSALRRPKEGRRREKARERSRSFWSKVRRPGESGLESTQSNPDIYSVESG